MTNIPFPTARPQRHANTHAEIQRPDLYNWIDADLSAGMSIADVAAKYGENKVTIRFRYQLLFNPAQGSQNGGGK